MTQSFLRAARVLHFDNRSGYRLLKFLQVKCIANLLFTDCPFYIHLLTLLSFTVKWQEKTIDDKKCIFFSPPQSYLIVLKVEAPRLSSLSTYTAAHSIFSWKGCGWRALALLPPLSLLRRIRKIRQWRWIVCHLNIWAHYEPKCAALFPASPETI